MIYDSLDKIPYKTFIKISETENYSLLSDTETDEEILKGIWLMLYDEHMAKETNSEGKRVFRISKEIEFLDIQLKLILLTCEALKFDYDEDCFNRLLDYGYRLRCDTTENYYNDLQQIERESNSFKIKINTLSKLLPKTDGEKQEFNVDDVMASYCSILGYPIGDFNSITYTAFFSHEKQVNAKIKSIKNQQNTNKNGKS